MDATTTTRLLREHGVLPSPQRIAVARYVLDTTEHPSADQVFARVAHDDTSLSRATVYNTLHLLVDKGLLRELVVTEGRTVYDPCLQPHHHFVDDDTGAITDIAWDALQVRGVDGLAHLDVREHQVVLRGRQRA